MAPPAVASRTTEDIPILATKCQIALWSLQSTLKGSQNLNISIQHHINQFKKLNADVRAPRYFSHHYSLEHCLGKEPTIRNEIAETLLRLTEIVIKGIVTSARLLDSD